jgi:hypothetical protein
LTGAEEQVVEVHRVGAVDLALVELVDVGDRLLEVGPDELAVVLGRAQLVLGVGDLGLHRRGVKRFGSMSRSSMHCLISRRESAWS